MYTSTVQAHIIVTLMSGPGQSFKTLEYTDLNSGESSQIPLAEFFDKLLTDIMARIMKNPLVMMHEYFADNAILSSDKYYFKNCLTIRSFIGSIIDEKKAAKNPDASDVISLILQDENYQVTEDIIDDVIVMFFAGSKTVQTATTNLISTMQFEPEEYERLRSEIDPFMDKVKGDIMGKMDLESLQELEIVK